MKPTQWEIVLFNKRQTAHDIGRFDDGNQTHIWCRRMGKETNGAGNCSVAWLTQPSELKNNVSESLTSHES